MALHPTIGRGRPLAGERQGADTMPRVKTPPIGWILFGTIAVAGALYGLRRRSAEETRPFTVAICREDGRKLILTDSYGQTLRVSADDISATCCNPCPAAGTVVSKPRGSMDYIVNGHAMPWRDDLSQFKYLGALAVVVGGAAELYLRRKRRSSGSEMSPPR